MSSLFVAWRPPDEHAGGNAPQGTVGWRPVGYLEHKDNVYRFLYTLGARQPGFRPFAGMEQLDQVYESVELMPLFANRLLSAARPEYESYLRWSGFDPAQPPDPLVLLGVTEGIGQTDAIEVFPCPEPDSDGCYLNRFFLHGIRWLPAAAMERINRLDEGEPLKLLLDFQNENDPWAVAVRTDTERTFVGYVPRYLAPDVAQLYRQCEPDAISVRVVRANPRAPLQQRLLCEMRTCWPEGFRPCSDELFQPIPLLESQVRSAWMRRGKAVLAAVRQVFRRARPSIGRVGYAPPATNSRLLSSLPPHRDG